MSADVGHLRGVVLVSRVVNGVVADNEDHLRHFRTRYYAVRIERAVFIALNHAQRSEHVHGILGLNVGLIRECPHRQTW